MILSHAYGWLVDGCVATASLTPPGGGFEVSIDSVISITLYSRRIFPWSLKKPCNRVPFSGFISSQRLAKSRTRQCCGPHPINNLTLDIVVADAEGMF
jgi:hypothetical protein